MTAGAACAAAAECFPLTAVRALNLPAGAYTRPLFSSA
jgi:hypothetical protein